MEITKSSIESANASSAAPINPGVSSGRVTVRKVVSGVAPRSRAASSSWRSKPISRERTTITTNEIENMTWASSRLKKPSEIRVDQEHREQRGADHDLGRRHRDHDQEVGHAAAVELVADERHRDHRPENGRDQRRQRREPEAHQERVGQLLDAEHVGPGVGAEAAPGVVELALGVVEREDGDQRDRDQQVGDRSSPPRS